MGNIIHRTKAQRTTVDGKSFPSKLEAGVYSELKLSQRMGLIKNLTMQKRVELTRAKIPVKIDFHFETVQGHEIYAEAKGIETEKWQLIVKLWRVYGPAPLWIYRANHRGVFIAEVITP